MGYIFAILNGMICALIAFTPFKLWPVCAKAAADGGHMHCWYTGALITACGALLCVIAVVYLAARNRWARSISWIGSVGLIAAAYLAETGRLTVSGNGWALGLCGMESMACRAVMMPHVMWLAAALLAVNVLWLVCSFVTGK